MKASTAIKALFLLTAALLLGVLAVALLSGEAKMRATILMGVSAFLIWVCLLGGLMYLLRDRIKGIVTRIPLPAWLVFFLFTLALALLEEAVAVSMTNLAPLFGVAIGAAYMTASASYLDVVLHHSVILFLPMFAGWAWLLSRYKFSPTAVFFLWGVLGFFMELAFSGFSQPLMFGYWIFIYGLMIWLPAYCLPEDRPAKEPRFYHYALSIIVPIVAFLLFAALMFVIALVTGWNPLSHPRTHFG